MIDRGAPTFTPGSSAISIPAGRYTGGTISAVSASRARSGNYLFPGVNPAARPVVINTGLHVTSGSTVKYARTTLTNYVTQGSTGNAFNCIDARSHRTIYDSIWNGIHEITYSGPTYSYALKVTISLSGTQIILSFDFGMSITYPSSGMTLNLLWLE